MAEITVTVIDGGADGGYQVSVRGPLAPRDLRRLERACGPALEHRTLRLEIRLEDTAALDESALFFLHRLRARGARLTGHGV